MSLLNRSLTTSLPLSFFNMKISSYALLGAFFYIIYTKIIYPYHLSPYRNLPRPRNTLFYYLKLKYYRSIGNFEYYLQIIQQYGPVVHLGNNIVLINDSPSRKYWLTYKFAKPDFYSVFDINGPNLFSSTQRDFHSKMKKLLSPAFSSKTLSNMENTIYRVGSESLVQFIQSNIQLNDENEFDLFHLFHCSTLDVISELIFGTNLNTTHDQKKAKYYIKELGATQKMMFLRTIVPFYYKIPFPMEKLFKPMILNNIELRKSQPQDDILQSMIDSEDPDTGAKLTTTEIVDECLILLFAGMDTTANTLTWTIYELLKNPETYKLVENEILTNFPDLNQPISLDKVKHELKYLEAAILESMRKHPVAAGILSRVIPEGGITVAGHYLPEKTIAGFRVFNIHNDPQYWENPEMYDIHRWLGDQREANKSLMMGFGLGPRSCIGRELAWNEIYLVLANLIRNFEMELVDTELTPCLKFLYKPKEKRMRVKMFLRN